MKSTDTNARSEMGLAVLIIFAATLIMAGVYFFVLTPGKPTKTQFTPATTTNEGAKP